MSVVIVFARNLKLISFRFFFPRALSRRPSSIQTNNKLFAFSTPPLCGSHVSPLLRRVFLSQNDADMRSNVKEFKTEKSLNSFSDPGLAAQD